MLNGCVKWYQQQLDNQQNQYAFFTNCFTRLEFLINEIEFNQNVDILDSVKNEIDFGSSTVGVTQISPKPCPA